MKDDLLSVKGKPKISGKLSLTREIRPNYAILMGIKKTESRLKFFTDHAIKSLKSFKGKAKNLIEITRYLKGRNY
jgi:geranylgeranyl pyrophosphate synthase